jgi:hypothetical protein
MDFEFHFVFLVFEFVWNGIFELEPFFSLIFELIFEDFDGLFVLTQENGLCPILLLDQCQLLFALCVLDFKVFNLEMTDEVLFVFDFWVFRGKYVRFWGVWVHRCWHFRFRVFWVI